MVDALMLERDTERGKQRGSGRRESRMYERGIGTLTDKEKKGKGEQGHRCMKRGQRERGEEERGERKGNRGGMKGSIETQITIQSFPFPFFSLHPI